MEKNISITQKNLMEAIDDSVEDLKNIFRYARLNNSKFPTLHIPGSKIGTLRYILNKNIIRRSNNNKLGADK